MVVAYIGLGSNLGDRLGNLSRAVDAIAHLPETHVNEISHAYETEPAYMEEQPPFVNAVAEVETGLDAQALLSYLQAIEDEMGRVRVEENGPRVIDLDLLIMEDEEWSTDTLTLPHPGIAERDFVVTPLLELAPGLELEGKRLRRVDAVEGKVVRDLGRIPDAGAEHNMPLEPTEWVEVAQSEGPQSAVGGYDAGLQFKRQALEQDSIPYGFEPFEPGLGTDILGRPQVFRLVVPAEYADRALELIDELESAPSLDEGPGEF